MKRSSKNVGHKESNFWGVYIILASNILEKAAAPTLVALSRLAGAARLDYTPFLFTSTYIWVNAKPLEIPLDQKVFTM